MLSLCIGSIYFIVLYVYRLGGLADSIFTSMEPKTPEAYCAIIQGMAKYYQVNISLS